MRPPACSINSIHSGENTAACPWAFRASKRVRNPSVCSHFSASSGFSLAFCASVSGAYSSAISTSLSAWRTWTLSSLAARYSTGLNPTQAVKLAQSSGKRALSFRATTPARSMSRRLFDATIRSRDPARVFAKVSSSR